MPAVPSGDRALEDMPLYIRAALGLNRDWVVHGYCRHADGGRDIAWRCTPGERVTIKDGTKFIGAELIALAEATCELCPVQWECARFAVRAEVNVGTWGMSYEDLEWMKDNVKVPIAFIDAADDDDLPVQVAVRRARQLLAQPTC
jgi:hypothetical protein